MADNIAGIPFSTLDEGIDYPYMAKELAYLNGAKPLDVTNYKEDFSINDVYIVWFAYVLGGWKALCSTSIPDGRYYEVTYNATKGEAYVDTYKKTHNVAVQVIKAPTCLFGQFPDDRQGVVHCEVEGCRVRRTAIGDGWVLQEESPTSDCAEEK